MVLMVDSETHSCCSYLFSPAMAKLVASCGYAWPGVAVLGDRLFATPSMGNGCFWLDLLLEYTLLVECVDC